MIQCLLISGGLFLFSPDGNSMMQINELTHLWKEGDTLRYGVNYSTFSEYTIALKGLPEDMTLMEVVAECDKVAWENYDETLGDG